MTRPEPQHRQSVSSRGGGDWVCPAPKSLVPSPLCTADHRPNLPGVQSWKQRTAKPVPRQTTLGDAGARDARQTEGGWHGGRDRTWTALGGMARDPPPLPEDQRAAASLEGREQDHRPQRERSSLERDQQALLAASSPLLPVCLLRSCPLCHCEGHSIADDLEKPTVLCGSSMGYEGSRAAPTPERPWGTEVRARGRAGDQKTSELPLCACPLSSSPPHPLRILFSSQAGHWDGTWDPGTSTHFCGTEGHRGDPPWPPPAPCCWN